MATGEPLIVKVYRTYPTSAGFAGGDFLTTVHTEEILVKLSDQHAVRIASYIRDAINPRDSRRRKLT